jgi:RecB family endonuclease NucS
VTDAEDDRAPVGTLVDPALGRAFAFVEDALASDRYLTVVGECRVVATVDTHREHPVGRRHVTCKPDGAVLVHDATGQRPIHPQPDGDRVDVRRDDATGDLVVEAGRERGDRLVVRFEVVSLVTAADVDDPDAADVSGTEADLKSLVLSNPERVEPGLRPLATERDTSAGPVDVYAEADDGQPVVLELKRDRAGPAAVSQLARYVDALARDLHAEAAPRGVLVAPSVTPRARQLLAENDLEFAAVEPPRA